MKKISIIIPIYNEEENLKQLFAEIYDIMTSLKFKFEVIAINDGSLDNSLKVLKKLSQQHSDLKIINFTRNFGQTAAMSAGFDNAAGEIIIPIDSDLQNDPRDIKNLIKKIDEGYDVVSGWRKNRKDSKFKRNFLSKVANKIISLISGVKLHDYGCTLKAYKKSVLQEVKLYGEMHRFIPIYTHLRGAKITEIEVNHRPRVAGKSKYGMERIFKTMLDLIVVKFIAKYFKKPIYLFGGVGLALLFLSCLSFSWAVLLKIAGTSFIKTPLPLFSSMSFILGIVCILMGIMTEVIVRIYFESQDKKSYIVDEIITKKKNQ